MARAAILATLAAALAALLGGAWWIGIQGSAGERSGLEAESAGAVYQCPMHPNVVADEPGSCPICGMSLSRVEPAVPVAARGEPAEHAGHEAALPHSRAPASHAPFRLAPERVQASGVKTAAVAYRELHVDLRTAGRVAFDPELYAALSEYRRALQAPGDAPDAGVRTLEHRRVLAVRLALLGVSLEQVEALFAGGADPEGLLLPGRSAWIYGEFYVPARELRPGQPVRVTSPALPGRTFRGELVTVDNVGATSDRGARVRALVATPGGGLRARSFVRLVVEVPLGRRLAVPEDAILDTGTRQLVFVYDGDGRFEPRDVVLGLEGEGHREVLSGLSPGERVVTAANFLIDSESRFRAALAAYGGGAEEPAPAP